MKIRDGCSAPPSGAPLGSMMALQGGGKGKEGRYAKRRRASDPCSLSCLVLLSRIVLVTTAILRSCRGKDVRCGPDPVVVPPKASSGFRIRQLEKSDRWQRGNQSLDVTVHARDVEGDRIDLT